MMRLKHRIVIFFSNQENGSRTLFNFPGEKKDIEYKYPDEEVSVILSDGHEPEISVEAIHHYKSAISIVDAGTCRESTMQVAKEVDIQERRSILMIQRKHVKSLKK